MSILSGANSQVASSRDSFQNSSIFKALVPEKGTKYPDQDFPEGLILTEVVDGDLSADEESIVVLNGNMMPFQPLDIGGEQRMNKRYYAGNPEPAVQILGSQEKDIVIKGRLKDRKYKDDSFYGAANAMREKIEAMRLRGNIIEWRLGEIVRYVVLRETSFPINRLGDIEYQLTFDVLGFTKPDNFNKVDEEKRIPFDINEDLLQAITEFQETFGDPPAGLPQNLLENINGLISDLASAITGVISYIDKVVSVIEDIAETINKAVGVVRYAQLSVFKFRQRLGRISLNTDLFINQGNTSSIGGISPASGTGTTPPTLALKYKNASYIGEVMSFSHNLTALLEQLRQSFIALQITIPLARHRVIEGQTAQNIAVKYYGSIDNYYKIIEHNNLQETGLTVGQVIEIPRL